MTIRIPFLLLLATFSLALACDTPKAKDAPTTPESKTDTKADKPATKVAEKTTDKPAPEDTGDKPTTPADPTAVYDGMGVGSTPEDIKPGETNMYGKKTFAMTTEPISLKDAIAKAADGEGPYKVSTKIEKVCQVKGCWFTLKEEGVSIPIRVRMKDYKFFVPKNVGGMPVITEGTFKKTTISEKMAQHYADDEAKATGKPAKKVEGDQPTYEFTATTIEIQANKG